LARLVIGTSRTVGSAKKFVRITSGFGGGEFTKTLRKVCTSQKLKFAFLLLDKLGVLIDGDFKFGVLLLLFVRFLGGDTTQSISIWFFVKSQC
jgi:hypothetical protein